jgi:preprotein translocase subunit SecA
MRHLTELDHLRQGIGLRAIAQQDPLVAYKREAADLWGSLIQGIEQGVVQRIFVESDRIIEHKFQLREMHVNRTDMGEVPAEPVKQKPVQREADKIGRNDPCPCGSGKKYKKCHGAEGAVQAVGKIRHKTPS